MSPRQFLERNVIGMGGVVPAGWQYAGMSCRYDITMHRHVIELDGDVICEAPGHTGIWQWCSHGLTDHQSKALDSNEHLIPGPVQKPEGFDLREKRASKNGRASDWTPADAVYEASRAIKDKEVSELVVYWWEKDPETGDRFLKFCNATSSRPEHSYLLQKALAQVIG